MIFKKGWIEKENKEEYLTFEMFLYIGMQFF